VATADIRKQWLAQLHPEDRVRVTTLFQDAMAGRAEYDIEYRVVLPDASVRWLASRARLINDRRGKPALLTGVSADITQRKQAQEALRRSAERLERALTAARMVAWEWRLADGTGEMFGDTSLWGAPSPPRSRQEVWEMIHPDDRPRALAMMSEAVEQRRSYVLRYRSVRPDGGAALWLEAHGTVVCDHSGQPTSIAGVTFDISERMRAEQELKRALAILQAVSVSTPNTIAVKDRQSRLLMANPGMLRMLGKSEAEVLGKTNSEFLGAERGAAIVANDQRVMETGLTETFEELVPGAEGLRVFLSTKSPLRDEHGRVTGMVVLGTDVTERKRIEEALRQADRRKDEFLATLAHELRNPLAPLRNGLEIMRIARSDPSVIEQAQHMMERQLGQMVRLIDDLLDLSRITLGKVELRLERVALASVVQSALEISRAPIEAGGHRLTVTLPPESVHLMADATRLAQVLANLLNNSAKYTEPGGQIWLSAQREGERVVLRVRDTGVGIPAHLLPAVFDLFVQAERSLDRAQGGLGVGLTLVKRLVEMHGGTVEAHSAGPGQGSEFVVRLPALLIAAARGEEGRERRADAARFAPRRILVADDNEDAAASMAMMLSLLGHEVRTVHDGAAAVEAAVEFRPDIALLDIGMPRVDGLEAARRIRAQPEGTRLILVALTGWSQPEDQRRSQEAGFDHHLVKPADMEALRALLDPQQRTRRDAGWDGRPLTPAQ
jgi:PAS domain S-box-containing protein